MKQMIHRMALPLLCCVMAAMFSSCASIFDGVNHDVYIDGPAGARVFINEQFVGVAPCSIRLRKKRTYDLLIDAPDKANYEAVLVPKVKWGVVTILECIPAGIPFFIDRIIGGAYTHKMVDSEKALNKRKNKKNKSMRKKQVRFS